MSVAPTSLTKALDSVGEDLDEEFKVWRKQLSCHLSREVETKKEVNMLRQSLVSLMLIHLVAGLKEYISSWQIGIMRTSFLM